MKKSGCIRWISVLVLVVMIAAGTLTVYGKDTLVQISHDRNDTLQTDSSIEPEVDPLLIPFFESIGADIPVSMEYWVFGEAPYALEFSNPDLIEETLEALKTVEIGGVSDTNPDYVADAGGIGYAFMLEDGSTAFIDFIMGTFYSDGIYYNVNSIGNLDEVNMQLRHLGDPDYYSAYSEDDGFSVRYSELYEIDWEEEDNFFGGIMIYPGYLGEVPFVSVARCEGEDDAEAYLAGHAQEALREALDEQGWILTAQSEITEYEYHYGRIKVPGILWEAVSQDGSELEILVLAVSMEDDYMDEMHVLRVCAVYPKEDVVTEEEKDRYGLLYINTESLKDIMERIVDNAVTDLDLEYMKDVKQDIQPGSTLLEFCNHEGLNAWFEEALKNPPAVLTYTSDRWHDISDPDSIRTILKALSTVVIGDVSDAHVGASGRQIFDFLDDNGEGPSFMFFMDTFDWDGESYDVLDWGDLADLDIIAMAD